MEALQKFILNDLVCMFSLYCAFQVENIELGLGFLDIHTLKKTVSMGSPVYV